MTGVSAYALPVERPRFSADRSNSGVMPFGDEYVSAVAEATLTRRAMFR